MTVSPTFIIVGAGYGGLATAIELAKKNVKATVYESVKALTNQGE
jgi:2-polyprenyl-6-methoxyphenol hydroxylase-like FAD-dependent oxidoreductase